jgi:methylenetetrahydrofolate dehydrogenase (NADP+)/methenyltetrahydrofolate cyclohydrolase
MEAAKAENRADIIDGRAVAKRVKERVARAVERLGSQGITPCLAVIQVGDNPSSSIYIRNKRRAAARLGIESRHINLPDDVTEETLNSEIAALNADDGVDGILLQLPLPDHLVPRRHIREIDPLKDADGFHPMNLGRLIVWDSILRPCTPAGVMELLWDRGTELPGKHAVVISRSVVVGRPLVQLLLKYGATVTVCHRHTVDLRKHVEAADILVTAAGVPGLVKGAWIKRGAIVIDVAIERLDNGDLAGDVEFEAALQRAGAITPVPGGVGPMTIAMLMKNTVIAARLRRGLEPDPDLD